MQPTKTSRSEKAEIQKLRNFVRKRYIDSDVKYVDFERYNTLLQGNTLTSVNYEQGSFNSLNYISEGAGVNERVGRKYLLTGLAIRGKIVYEAQNTASANPIARIIVYCDRRVNTGNGVASLLLEAPSNAENTIFAYRALGSEERFDVFVDRTFVFRPTANVSSTESTDATWNFDFYVDLSRFMYECEGPANYTVPTNYSLRMAVLCNSSGDMRLSYCARTRFRG